MTKYEAFDAIREAFAVWAGEFSTSVTEDEKFRLKCEDIIAALTSAMDDEYAFGYERGQEEYFCDHEAVNG